MNFVNIPFTKLSLDDTPRPWLPVIVINPHSGRRLKILGLIDTGADECAMPARYAPILGHNLEAGVTKEINTGNGMTLAYSHTLTLDVSGFVVQETLIDFMPNLHVPLLGIRSFLNNFVLTVDFPRKVFSLLKPVSKK